VDAIGVLTVMHRSRLGDLRSALSLVVRTMEDALVRDGEPPHR